MNKRILPAVTLPVALLLTATMLLTAWLLIPFLLGPEMNGMRVSRGELVQIITLPGKLQLAEQLAVAGKQAGKVHSVAVAAGDPVKAGQTLLTFDNAKEHEQLAQVKKEVALASLRMKQAREKLRTGSDLAVEKAKSTLNNSRKQYARINSLAAKGLVSSGLSADALRNLAIAQSQLSTAQFQAKASRAQGSEYALAESALNNARAREKQAQQKLDNTVIKSTLDGVLISRSVEPGQVVSANTPLLLVASAASAQVRVQVEGDNLARIKPGQAASLLGNAATNGSFTLPLGTVPADFDASQASAELKFALSHAPANLANETKVQVAFEVAHLENVLSLDTAAIHDAQGAAPWVLAVSDGKVQRRMIRVGACGNLRMQVLEGLQEGDMVLPVSAQDMEEGKRIRLARN